MKVAFLLTGEHSSLPKAEVKAVLEVFNIPFLEYLDMDSLLVLDVRGYSEELANKLASRLAFTRSLGRLVSAVKHEEFPKELNRVTPPEIIGKFRVRAVRIRGCCREMRRVDVEKEIGRWILKGNPGSRVDLENPRREVLAVLTSGHVMIYMKDVEVDRALFKIKEVAARPFVHPASMRPTLARAMVNLARTREGDLVLDPFMGVGGIALEALSVGARLIGADVNESMIIGAKNNLIAYGFLEGFKLMLGNALDLDLGEMVDRIVTDPPYGRMSAAFGNSPKDLVKKFVRKAGCYLKERGWIAISAPIQHLDINDFDDAGFEVVEYFDVREHKSLTRRIWVARLAG